MARPRRIAEMGIGIHDRCNAILIANAAAASGPGNDSGAPS